MACCIMQMILKELHSPVTSLNPIEIPVPRRSDRFSQHFDASCLEVQVVEDDFNAIVLR